MSGTDQRRRAVVRGRGQHRDRFGRLTLTRQEAKILNCLLCNQGRIVSKAELVDWLWGEDEDGGPLYADSVIKTRIFWLRSLGWPIETSWGRGYIIRWSDQEAPTEVTLTPIKPEPKECRAILTLRQLQQNVGRFVHVHRPSVLRLRRRGWKIEGQYGKGYCLDISVVGTMPNPRYSGNNRRYARAA